MSGNELKTTCDLCGSQFHYGNHRYDGRYNPTYEIMTCHACHDANWDGWARHMENRVTARLKAQGKPLPARNEKGWLPRDA